MAEFDSNASPDDAIHAARAAPEQQTNFVVRPIALVNAHFLPFALGKIHQFGGHRQAGGLLQQRANLPPQRAARDVGQAEGVFHHRIIRAADFERALAGADVQSGLARQIAFQNQFSNQLQFRLRCVRTHVNRFLFVVCDDGFEQIAEAFVTAGIVFARHLQQQFLERIETPQRMPRDGVSQAGPQHDELLLALAFRRPHCPAHRVIKTPQLAPGPGIHVAHAADDTVGLIIQVQRIGD